MIYIFVSISAFKYFLIENIREAETVYHCIKKQSKKRLQKNLYREFVLRTESKAHSSKKLDTYLFSIIKRTHSNLVIDAIFSSKIKIVGDWTTTGRY